MNFKRFGAIALAALGIAMGFASCNPDDLPQDKIAAPTIKFFDSDKQGANEYTAAAPQTGKMYVYVYLGEGLSLKKNEATWVYTYTEASNTKTMTGKIDIKKNGSDLMGTFDIDEELANAPTPLNGKIAFTAIDKNGATGTREIGFDNTWKGKTGQIYHSAGRSKGSYSFTSHSNVDKGNGDIRQNSGETDPTITSYPKVSEKGFKTEKATKIYRVTTGELAGMTSKDDIKKVIEGNGDKQTGPVKTGDKFVVELADGSLVFMVLNVNDFYDDGSLNKGRIAFSYVVY